jgi:hypothetical protein
LITPPNFGSGGGSCFPLIVVVALGEPGVPVICWPTAVAAQAAVKATLMVVLTALSFITFLLPLITNDSLLMTDHLHFSSLDT